MTKITNVSRATQGVNAKSGTVFLRPGETRDLELHDSESAEDLAGSPHLSVEGFEKPDNRGRTLGDMNANIGVAQPDADSKEREEYIEELEGELTTARSEITSLKDDNAQLSLDLEAANAKVTELENARDGVMSGLVGKHKGGGSYSVYQGDTEVLAKLTGEQSTEFNALDGDAAKTQWVKDHTVTEKTEEP